MDRATPQVDRLPDLDALLELGLLELYADAVLQLGGVRRGIVAENSDLAGVGRASPSTHSMVVVLPAPFGPMRPKISPSLTSKEMSSTAIVGP